MDNDIGEFADSDIDNFIEYALSDACSILSEEDFQDDILFDDLGDEKQEEDVVGNIPPPFAPNNGIIDPSAHQKPSRFHGFQGTDGRGKGRFVPNSTNGRFDIQKPQPRYQQAMNMNPYTGLGQVPPQHPYQHEERSRVQFPVPQRRMIPSMYTPTPPRTPEKERYLQGPAMNVYPSTNTGPRHQMLQRPQGNPNSNQMYFRPNFFPNDLQNGKRKPDLPSFLPNPGYFRIHHRQSAVKYLESYGRGFQMTFRNEDRSGFGERLRKSGQQGLIYENKSDCITIMILPIPWNEQARAGRPLQISRDLVFRFELERSHYYKGIKNVKVVPNTSPDRYTTLFEGQNVANVFKPSRYISQNPNYEIVNVNNNRNQQARVDPNIKYIRISYIFNGIVSGKSKGINRFRATVLENNNNNNNNNDNNVLTQAEYFFKCDNRKEQGSKISLNKYSDYVDMKTLYFKQMRRFSSPQKQQQQQQQQKGIMNFNNNNSILPQQQQQQQFRFINHQFPQQQQQQRRRQMNNNTYFNNHLPPQKYQNLKFFDCSQQQQQLQHYEEDDMFLRDINGEEREDFGSEDDNDDDDMLLSDDMDSYLQVFTSKIVFPKQPTTTTTKKEEEDLEKNGEKEHVVVEEKKSKNEKILEYVLKMIPRLSKEIEVLKKEKKISLGKKDDDDDEEEEEEEEDKAIEKMESEKVLRKKKMQYKILIMLFKVVSRKMNKKEEEEEELKKI